MIAFIDPSIINPVVNCFTEFVDRLETPVRYYMPAKFPIETLFQDAPKIHAYFLGGSASNVTEPLEWHKPLADFLVGELKKNKPVFGACFGHQLLCHAFGSDVNFYQDNHEKVLGKRRITMTENYKNLKKGESFTLAVSHRQVVKKLGPGLKAIGEGFLNDIVIHETLPMMTTQAHPEASKHFCIFDIANLSQSEEELVRKEGKIIIDNFFKTLG